MEFIKKLLHYFSANPALTMVLIACAVFIAIVITVICVLSATAKKAQKRLETTPISNDTTNIAKEPVDDNETTEEPQRLEESSETFEQTVEPNESTQEAEKAETTEERIESPVQTEETETLPVPPVQEEKNETPAVEEKPIEKTVKTPSKTTKSTPKAKPVNLVKTETETAKKEPIPSTAPVAPATNEKKNKKRYTGKWMICHLVTKENEQEDLEETYFFELHASNGEKLLSSEEYTSYQGVLKGIETHKANILKNNFRIGLTKKGDYIFKLLNGKNTLLCTGENYPTKNACERAIESTKRFAETAVVDENVHDIFVHIPFEAEETVVQPIDNGYVGKWIISKTTAPDGDEIYYFELFASNGEKLLSSEEYTSYVGALNGINTHKNNIEKDRFRISFTKRGDYIYKLLSSNGQLLCLGEHYKTKRRCESAVESVKRFAKNAPILTAANIAQKSEN